jgi:hypothetical protein
MSFAVALFLAALIVTTTLGFVMFVIAAAKLLEGFIDG